MQLTTVYSHHVGGVRVGTLTNLLNPIDETRLSVNGTGSYGFSSNVTGDLSLGFNNNHDNTKDIVRRSVRVEVRAQFRF